MRILILKKLKVGMNRLQRTITTALFFGLIIGLAMPEQGMAQNAKPPAQPAQQPKEKEKLPAPQSLTLATKDGVKLRCTYFGRPESEKGAVGKSVIPIILLHDWEGSRRQMLRYGSFLQSVGHAAIVPDLRGHGESVIVDGLDKPINFEKFRKSEIPSAMKDIERCKKFLVKQHNQERVNIDLLSVVAVGKTSVLAVVWTYNDWYAFPPVNQFGVKQGQDVKALLLVAPKRKLAGISMGDSLRHPMFSGAGGAELPMMIVWGSEDENSKKDSERLHTGLKKSRPDVRKIENPEERFAKTTLFGLPITRNGASSMTGVQLMASPAVDGLWNYTNNFFVKKVGEKSKEYVWKTRDIEKKKEE